MKVIELKREMDAKFDQVHERFARVDEQFARVDERFAQVDERFNGIDHRLDGVDQRLDGIDGRLSHLDARIIEEGETTRRRFDVVAEQMKAEFKVALDATAAMVTNLSRFRLSNANDHVQYERMLDEHEARLKAVESQR